MPRSWPNTDAEPIDGFVQVAGKASDRREASSIEVEVIDLSSADSTPVNPETSTTSHRGWLVWIMIAVMVGGGLALLPEDTIEPPTAETPQILPEPESATTSTTLAAISQAVMSDDTFSLMPASGLDGYVQFAGPIEFSGKHWIAGNYAYPSTDVSILSSVDGTRWSLETNVSAGEGSWLRIDDLDSFGGVLMAVGTVGPTAGPAYAPTTPGSLVLWKSTDGLRWSSLPIAEDEGLEYAGLQLTPSSEEVLISGYSSAAFDPSLLAQVPPELTPGLERGDFYWWHDYSSSRVVAPPGIELFQMPVSPSPPSGFMSLFRSDNLIIWEPVPVSFSAWNIIATADGGFATQTREGTVMYSDDGRSWERTDRYPALFYQSWGDRLVGLDYSVMHPNLVVIDGEEIATIDLPAEISVSPYGVSVTPGASGLATVVVSDQQAYVEPITRIEGYILSMDSGVLRIEEPSGETSYAVFDGDGLIGGSYVPESNSIRFESTDGSKSFEFPVAAFLDLRGRPQPGRFDVFLSNDGLAWARPQTGLRAEYVDILGSAGQTFLVALHNFGADYRELPITVYRTGPIG